MFNRYFNFLFPENPNREARKLHYNPAEPPQRQDSDSVRMLLYTFSGDNKNEQVLNSINEINPEHYEKEGTVAWLNIIGMKKEDIHILCQKFDIHHLQEDDIWSTGQRPKMDEDEDYLYFLLNMLYYKQPYKNFLIQEQISIFQLKNIVITIQENPAKDIFLPVANRLQSEKRKIQQLGADFLCYSIIDFMVDNYFWALEEIENKIDYIEREIIRAANARTLSKINYLRKELIILKRNVLPSRDVVGNLQRNYSDKIHEKTQRYYKDVYDHIVQAVEMAENYHEMSLSMQDLYLNKVNLRLNESMKVMAIVTCLLAPATVISGIFGMNFERAGFQQNHYGFIISVAAMLLIPVWMIFVFKRRGWF